jgi:4-carboxymuconolactone decarboxylase
MHDSPEPRLEAPDPESYDARQREVHDAIASGPRGGVRGPLAVWLHRPELADHAQALGRYCRYETLLPPRLSELAILTIAAIWQAGYEWQAHAPIALKAGIAPETIETIRTGGIPRFDKPDEELVYAFTRAAQLERGVDDALYDRAVATLGTEAVVDLVGLIGYYTLISLTINVFRVASPAPGQTNPG